MINALGLHHYFRNCYAFFSGEAKPPTPIYLVLGTEALKED